MQLSKIQLAILGLIFANIIWGASFPIYKWTLEVVPPFTFVFLRFFLAALIIFPFVYKSIKIARADIPRLILASILGITIAIPLLFFGLQLTPSINAPIIAAFGPIILIITAFIFLNEKIRAKVLAGTLISFIGVLVIILRPVVESGGNTGSVLGNLLIFGAVLSYIASLLLIKKIIPNNNPLTVTFWLFVIGSLPLLPLVLFESQSFNFLYEINSQAIIGILYSIIFPAALAHIFLAYGLKYIKASEVGIFGYLGPIATIIIAVPLLGEVITPIYIIGTILVFFGIIIAEGHLHYHLFYKLRAKPK